MELSTVTVNTHNKTLGVSPTDVTEQGEHAYKILTPLPHPLPQSEGE